jgi:HD-like signal output (HDOD) protein
VVERELFGVDHATIGSWLAQAWGLSDNICKGIAYHHAPALGLPEPLVAVVHVGEVLNHALNLSHARTSHVRTISEACCAQLGLDWGDDSHGLFGRIEARSRHAFAPYISGS